jgi:hypothetical protein
LVRDVYLGEESRCTGTLVTPTHVLTAAHCGADVWSPARLRNITVLFTGDQFNAATLERRGVTDCQLHPLWDDWDASGDPRPCGSALQGAAFSLGTPHDLLILTLDRPVAPAWADASVGLRRTWHALPPTTLTNVDLLGEPVTAIGYGSTIMVWMERDIDTDARELWTSPHAVSAAEMAPRRLGVLESAGLPMIGDGLAAIVQNGNELLVFTIADGSLRRFMPGFALVPRVSGVTEDEVFVVGQIDTGLPSRYLRVDLSALDYE